MQNDKDFKKHGTYYVIFMERAYGMYESPEPGMQASVIEDLIIAENQRVDSTLS